MFRDRFSGGKPSVVRSVITFVILAVVVLLIFTTAVNVDMGDSKLTLKSSFYSTVVPYSSITELELRDELSTGSRANGVGTFTISGGHFNNKEFGSYNLYISNKVKSYVVIHSGNVVTVFNMKTVEDTKAAYDFLNSKIAH